MYSCLEQKAMTIFPQTKPELVSSRPLPRTWMNPIYCICRQTTTKECPYVRANTRVNWVGCDGPLCARWFHLHCVGLLDRNFAQVGKSKFLCPICSASWETCSFLSRLFLKKQDLRFVISPLTYSNVSLQFMSIMQGILLSYHLLQSRLSFIYDLFHSIFSKQWWDSFLSWCVKELMGQLCSVRQETLFPLASSALCGYTRSNFGYVVKRPFLCTNYSASWISSLN